MSNPFKEPFDYSKSLATKLVRTGHGKNVVIIDEETAKLKPKLATELQRTYKLFASGKPAAEYLNSAEKAVKRYVSTVLKDNGISASKFKIDVGESNRTVGDAYALSVYIEHKKSGEEVLFEHESLYIPSISEFGEDAADSYEWAWWLMDEDSPFYSEEFTDSYRMTEVGQALEQFAHTLDESSFADDLISEIEKLEG